MTEYVYNLSYGKDSMAGLHVCIDILGWPVDRIVHAEVWATDTIPADLPPMVEFKAEADRFIKERWGLTVEHIFATRGGSCDPMQVPSTSGMNEGSTPASCEGSPCAEGLGAKTGSSGAFSKIPEKLTYEKMFYHVPKRKGKNADRFGGGDQGVALVQRRDCLVQEAQNENILGSRTQSGVGAKSSNTGRILGFPIIKGNWCTSNLKRRVFLQPPATRGG